jgi:hypothetical protein|tara:strand:+ start:6640 stop:6873 length:234 start_codon:yes stop_codon:yes gene_type:complete
MVDQKTMAETKLSEFFTMLLELQNKTSKSNEDSILLAGAMMGVAQMILYENLVPVEADNLMHHNTSDFISLIKPTIH